MSANADRIADNQCRNCGSFVSKQYARVFGNNQNEIDLCPDCSSLRERTDGEAGRASNGQGRSA